MSLTFGFFDSVNGDRKYNAQQMSAIFDGIINDGVFNSVGGIFAVSPAGGMSVKVASGRAWFNHTWTYNDADYPLVIAAAEVALTRIDAIVLEVNNDSGTRANAIKVVKGVAATPPKRPTLTNNENVHQHALAYVTVSSGTTAITSSMIEMVVGTSETPFVTGILETTTIESLWSTWSGQFNEWFDHVKGQLDEDAAGNLQNQIDNCVKNANKATLAEARAGTNDNKWMTPAKTAALLDPLNQCRIGDIHHSGHNLEVETNGAFIKIDGRVIDRAADYPDIFDLYELQHRIATPNALEVTSTVKGWAGSTNQPRGVCIDGRYFWVSVYVDSDATSNTAKLCMRKVDGTVVKLEPYNVGYIAVCNGQLIAVTKGDNTVRAYVYDKDGTLIRNVQLNTSKGMSIAGIFVSGARCFILVYYSATDYVYGYYSDDNFSTFGSTAFGDAASIAKHEIEIHRERLTENIQAYNGDLYFLTCSPVTTKNDVKYRYLYLWKSTDGGARFDQVWSIYMSGADAWHVTTVDLVYFIHDGFVYVFSKYADGTGGLVKLSLTDGTLAATSDSFGFSERPTGFILDGHLYAAIPSVGRGLKFNLETLEYETWTPFQQGSLVSTRTDQYLYSILTRDKQYWVCFGDWFSAPATYVDTSASVYGGLVVLHIPTGRSVYLLGTEYGAASSSVGNRALPFEDDDGNVIISCGKHNSDDTFYDSKLVKLDFSKIKLPALDYAYLKVMELDS